MFEKRCREIGKVICKNLQLRQYNNVENICRMCERYMTPVILKDELWTAGEMVLCHECIEKHVLKREMIFSDLALVPDNYPYFKGYSMKKEN